MMKVKKEYSLKTWGKDVKDWKSDEQLELSLEAELVNDPDLYDGNHRTLTVTIGKDYKDHASIRIDVDDSFLKDLQSIVQALTR